MMPESENNFSEHLLVLVLDINPYQKLFTKNPGYFTAWLDSVLIFANSHLMIGPKNSLVVIGAHGKSVSFLYPSTEETESDNSIRQIDGQYELFYQVEARIRRSVSDITKSEKEIHLDSLLAGGLCMSLTYINRCLKLSPDLSSRILVMTASGDSASQYMNYMNVFFAAQKQNIIIDAVTLDSDSPLLQQGADITGGTYMNLTDVSSLLQFLIWIYLPPVQTRSQLGLPAMNKVDYRAACFCHRQMINVGFVCSVCLSIFCRFSPICTTCQTVFRNRLI